MTAELANSVGLSSSGSECHAKTSRCLKAGCLERMTGIVGNTRLRAHPAISGHGVDGCAKPHIAYRTARQTRSRGTTWPRSSAGDIPLITGCEFLGQHGDSLSSQLDPELMGCP